MADKGSMLTVLMDAPTTFTKFIDACTCGRSDKAAVVAIRAELEQKDVAIERLEEEIRRKDGEKDNLITIQKDLQSQIEEIRLLLEAHATEAKSLLSDEQAVVRMQSKVRGLKARKEVEKKAEMGELPGQPRQERDKSIVKMQAKARARSARKLVAEKAEAGLLPGQQRMAAGGAATAATGEEGGSSEAYAVPAEEGSSMFDDNESVDSDYDYDEEAFEGLGNELMSGKLKLAKVYGQTEAPAAEDELEWEVRHFILYDTQRILHYDDLVDGVAEGDRGLIDLTAISSVDAVAGVPTFVLKGQQAVDHDGDGSLNKVYMFKIVPDHDEVKMRQWIAAIDAQLVAL